MIKFVLSILVSAALCIPTAFAQEDTAEFSIRVFGGIDTEVPTTPALLSAIPVAQTQIDIDWSVSTDNYVVSGYVVFRDGIPVATTTLTSYSDTGLSASTTYEYGVRAFDASFNYSTTSNLLGTTTLSVPLVVPEIESGNSQGTAARTVLDDFYINSGLSTSTLYIKTARPARLEIRWGRTTAYELGYIVTDRYSDNYKTTLTDLEPGTTYEYEVIGFTPFGNETLLKRGQFTTLSQQDFLPPANVNRFIGLADGNDIRLSWDLPYDDSFSFVRVVRSHLGFPSHPQDGAVVYQGSEESAIDAGILDQFSPVYYTAFVYDTAGNVSSGAITRVYAPGLPGQSSAVPVNPGMTPPDMPDNAFQPVVITRPDIRMPDISEIFLWQNNLQQSLADQLINIDSQAIFLISIPKDAVSDNLKTIIVSLSDPTDSRLQSSFLLRINKDKTAYEAVIAPLQLIGASKMVVEIYDYESLVVGTYQKMIQFGEAPDKKTVLSGGAAIFKDLLATVSLLTLLIILMAILLYFFYRHRRRGEDKR